MGAVGLFDAKTHFSEYVARAEAGEEVIITRHNKPVAKIVPLLSRSQAPDKPSFDPAQRRRAIALMGRMKAEWRAAHGEPKSGLSVEMVREMREERAQTLDSAARKPKPKSRR